MKVILPMILVIIVSAAHAQEPVVIERPMVNGKQKLMELHKRNAKYCDIYRIEIDNQTYIVNTCGGIVKEKSDD